MRWAPRRRRAKPSSPRDRARCSPTCDSSANGSSARCRLRRPSGIRRQLGTNHRRSAARERVEVPILLACQAADEGIGNVDLRGTTRALVLELRPNVIQQSSAPSRQLEGFRLRVHMTAPCRHRYTRYKRRRARCGVAPAIDGLLVPHALHLQRRLLFIQVRLCRVQQPQSIRLPWRPHTCLTFSRMHAGTQRDFAPAGPRRWRQRCASARRPSQARSMCTSRASMCTAPRCSR